METSEGSCYQVRNQNITPHWKSTIKPLGNTWLKMCKGTSPTRLHAKPTASHKCPPCSWQPNTRCVRKQMCIVTQLENCSFESVARASEKEGQVRLDYSPAPTQLALWSKRPIAATRVTLDNSTPQWRMCKIRVWPYNPLLRSRHNRQVELVIKT